MTEFTTTAGGREISPGPRGHSITGVSLSADGTVAYFHTDQPGTLNGMALPIGPRGPRGEYGDPGEARIRVDETVGYRVFLWDTATAGENMIYGDTGRWLLPDSTTWVRRVGNSVESNAPDPLTLPVGFRPDAAGFTWQYLTRDPWPETTIGTMSREPVPHRGLEGYTAATAQGFPGTAQEWIDMVYGVLPVNGNPGQYLGWGDAGPTWMGLPLIGPGPWVNITLTANWKSSPNQTAQVRLNNGTVEMIGEVVYSGPQTTAGIWEVDFIRIGVIPPAYAPDGIYEVPVRSFRGLPGASNTRIVMVLQIHTEGQISLGAFDTTGGDVTVPVLSGHTKVNLGAIPSYARRNSSTGG